MTCLRPGLTLEGGALEVDGEGTLLATEPTLLDARRNPGIEPAKLEEELSHLLGVERVIWLGEGIVGDDTDGHVDDLARFAAPGLVLCARESSPSDPNYAPLEDLAERLRSARDARGRRLEVIDLPMPPALFTSTGERLPASYANFYIANRGVLVPVFGTETDAQALAVIKRAFPQREVVGVPCAALVRGLGSVHCLTQQEPLP